MSWYDSFLSPTGLEGIQVGLNFLSAGQSYNAARQKATAERQWQAYHNAMVNISNAQNQNVVASNESMQKQAASLEDVNIQRGGAIAEAKSSVMAAAAGTQGRSVNEAMQDIQFNADQRRMDNQINLQNKIMGDMNQANQSNMNALMEQNNSPIPMPSAATYLMGALGKSVGPIEGLFKGMAPDITPKNITWDTPDNSLSSAGAGGSGLMT